jgi:hypothetical protein
MSLEDAEMEGRVDQLDAEVTKLEADVEQWRESRGMFVARLEKMQEQGNNWLTVAAVLALLNDCDMLAARKGVQL